MSHTILPSGLLVVDDDADIREALAGVLTDEGYEVFTASNGREAVALLESGKCRPCLVLLDLMMPVMNGFEVLQALALNAVLARIPVVVVSASHSPMASVPLMRKPIDVDRLLDTVRRHCEPTVTA